MVGYKDWTEDEQKKRTKKRRRNDKKKNKLQNFCSKSSFEAPFKQNVKK